MAQGRKHILPPPELELPRTLHGDRHRLEEVQVPVVTISATYKSEIAEHLGERSRVLDEAVFSRAHYSMGVAIFAQASRMGLTAWYVDPMNYVTVSDWGKIAFVERVGQLVARVPLFRTLKNISEKFVRQKLPVANAVQKPLIYVTQRARFPIICLHALAGSIIADEGKKVLQVVTDPQIRPEYIPEMGNSNIVFAVFDESTKDKFLDKSRELGISLDENRIVVTGPPVDPRIVDIRNLKSPSAFKKRGLRLVVATGGIGTNKDEIKELLENLLPELKKNTIQLILYAGTNWDFKEMFYNLCKKHNIRDMDSRVRIIYDESIVVANQELIDKAFSWADGFVTKPSGDMAYDAVAAGCFLLTLEPWGEWEKVIENVFVEKEISKKADVHNFASQINELARAGWIEKAIKNAINIDKIFLTGAKRIVDLQQKLAYNE